ncbi:MAG: ZIP family zinc transporter [Pseudomonadota bacterium]|nr:ZIP family zinc transporter [Pseudomonadota bacterium]
MADAGTLHAFGLGLLSASGLIGGALGGTFVPLRHRGIASLMALGAGVLLAVFALDLVASAMEEAGSARTMMGLLGGAAAFSGTNAWLSTRGAKHRKRCCECVKQISETDQPGSGSAIVLGSVMDAVPEALVLGLALRTQGAPDLALAAAFAIANVPEAWSSASGMKLAGRSKVYVFGAWSFVAIATGVAGAVGYVMLSADEVFAGLLAAVAAGALLAMVVETMVPEAFSHGARLSGTLATVGFSALLGLLWLLHG